MTESELREIIRQEIARELNARRVMDNVTAEFKEMAEARKVEQQDDGYLYFGGEGQEKDPRLPAGIKVEFREWDEGWVEDFYRGFLPSSSTYLLDNRQTQRIRVKKSEIIDIGERAVGRLVEAWDDKPDKALRGYCYRYAGGVYRVTHGKTDLGYYHIRLINNSEVKE